MSVLLRGLIIGLTAQFIAGQSSTGLFNASTGTLIDSSSTGPLDNQTLPTGPVFNQSSTGLPIDQSTGLFNQSSTGSIEVPTGLPIDQSTGEAGEVDYCYECHLPLIMCSVFPEFPANFWPRLIIHSSLNRSTPTGFQPTNDYDRDACNEVMDDISRITVQYPGADSLCADRVLNLTCSYAALRQANGGCDPSDNQALDQQYQADCLDVVSCFDAEEQAVVAELGFCTNITAFLNRPIVDPALSSTGVDEIPDDGGFNGAATVAASLFTVLVGSVALISM